jgi:hypothetical protein
MVPFLRLSFWFALILAGFCGCQFWPMLFSFLGVQFLQTHRLVFVCRSVSDLFSVSAPASPHSLYGWFLRTGVNPSRFGLCFHALPLSSKGSSAPAISASIVYWFGLSSSSTQWAAFSPAVLTVASIKETFFSCDCLFAAVVLQD